MFLFIYVHKVNSANFSWLHEHWTRDFLLCENGVEFRSRALALHVIGLGFNPRHLQKYVTFHLCSHGKFVQIAHNYINTEHQNCLSVWRGCSSVVERSLHMWEASGSIPDIFSNMPLLIYVHMANFSNCHNYINTEHEIFLSVSRGCSSVVERSLVLDPRHLLQYASFNLCSHGKFGKLLTIT